MHEHDQESEQETITPASAAPRLSWGVLAFIITVTASIAGSYVVNSVRISTLVEKVEEVDRKGTQGLAVHQISTKDELSDIRLSVSELKKDVQSLKEILDFRLGVIEVRLAISRPRLAPLPPGRQDEVKP